MLPQLDSPLSVSEPIWIEIFDKWSTAGKTFMADQESSQRAVHWLPCTVESNGPARVTSYFSSTVKRMDTQLDGQEVLEAHFRGRQLKGAFVKLPEGYKLLHLSKDPGAPGSKQGSGAWQVQQSCQHFMYWKHDEDCTKTDSVRRCLELLPLSYQVHRAVSPDAVEEQQAKRGL